MCGIAGIFDLNKQTTKFNSNLSAMLLSIKHRGPNDSGTWFKDGVHMGMTRLSIIDLTDAGHQPMISNDKRYVIVYNGEVYNYKELKISLEKKGYIFTSKTDTEVVLNLFIEYGKECVNMLRGMFAFAIWDNQSDSLFIARDHMGIKPFLYYYQDGVFVFCSELKGMLASGIVPKQLCKDGLNVFLQKGFIAPPLTALKEVKSLLPGQCAELTTSGEFKIDYYWDIKPKKVHTEITYEEATSSVKELVLKSVNEQLVSDVPLGVFLSGGLDSSVLVAAMRLNGVDQIDTFSIGFEQFQPQDESDDAEESAKHFKTKHHKIIINADYAYRQINKFIDGLDQPSVDGLNTFLVAEYARKNVTVALSGLGGDELFNGYAWQHRFYRATKSDIALGNLFEQFEKNLTTIGNLNNKIKNRFINSTSAYKNYENIHLIFTKSHFQQLFSVTYQDNIIKKSLANIILTDDYSRLQQINKIDMRFFMGAQLLRDSDAVAMANSLEVRFPLIDTRLVDYVYQLPDQYKIHHQFSVSDINRGFEKTISYKSGGVKKLLFDAFQPDLPESLNNRNKRGFKMPFNKWMQNDYWIKEIIECLITLEKKILQPGATSKLLAGWQANKIGWQQIWALYILQKWMEKNNIEFNT
ncbi:MAG: asparagine synthase (glutamine-hydrolyzing) [Bacteroidia bacterium]|jgi:asparagine synthase (glutamine-hydrolysing)|nr:asparagine synthase (glutamine-hydrolyzing) [Bacteroidia bacterium]